VKLTISHTSERADSKFIEAVSGARSSKADCRSAGAPRMNRQPLQVVSPTLTVFFQATRDADAFDEFKKIGRSTSIVPLA
jgi:hypothetical protein